MQQAGIDVGRRDNLARRDRNAVQRQAAIEGQRVDGDGEQAVGRHIAVGEAEVG